jgi:hypothetical protein
MAEDAAREVSGVLPKVAGGENISIKGVRENLGGGLDNFIKAVGDGKWGEALVTAATGTATYFETTFNDAVVNTKGAMDDLSKSTNQLVQIMGGLMKTVGGEFMEHEKITEVKDFIKFPGETVKPLEVDTILGMTKGKEALENMKPNSGGSSMGTSNIKMEDVNINLNIKIDAPSNVDTAQLMLAFNNQSVQGALIGAVQSALSNANGSNGLNPIEARKQMTKMANLA